MIQRRGQVMGTYRDPACPYQVWPEPGWLLGEDSELDEALTQLESALTECDVALASAIAEMTSQDVSSALRLLPFEQRSAVLQPLGLRLQPRHVTQALCQDVRNRMQRAEEHAARRAASALTTSTFIDIGRSVFAVEHRDAARPRDPLQPWSPALCRLAVWSHGLASVTDARVWLWAIPQSWFQPDGVSDEQLEAIVEAAERVVIASPKFTYLSSTDNTDDEPDDGTDDVVVGDLVGDDACLDGFESAGCPAGEAGDDAAEMRYDDQGHDMTDDVVTATVDGELESAREPAASSTLQGITVASDALEAVLAEGLLAAEDVLQRLSAKQPPRPEDLATLQRTRDMFDAVITSLAGAGAHVPEETMTAVRSAVEQLKAEAGDADARARLEIVCALVAPPEQALLQTQLAQVKTEVRDLLARQTWDALMRESASAIGLLAELATVAQDATAQMALMQQWSHARPELSFLALQARELMLASPPAESAGDSTSANQVADFEREEATVSLRPSAPLVESIAEMCHPVATEAGSSKTLDERRIATVGSATAEPEAPLLARSQVADSEHLDVEQAGVAMAQPQASAPLEFASFDQRPPSKTQPATDQDLASEAEQIPAERVTTAVAELISTQRLGLAAALERTVGWAPTQQAALRVAALACVIRNQTGAVAAALRAELDDLDPAALAADTPSLLLSVSGLLRAALVTGEPTVGALLTALASHIEPNLAEVAAQVGDRALHGVLLGSQALAVLADVTDVERGVQAISRTASRVRTRHRTLRFKRATDISKVWLSPRGILGVPLSIVERNDISSVEEVAASIERLGDGSFVKNELDKLDQRFRAASGKPIQGAGRQDLLNLVQEALVPLADWVAAVGSVSGRDARAANWSTGEVAAMRSAVLERRDSVLAALENLTNNKDPLTAAAAHAALASLTWTFDILQGSGTLPAREPAPALALTSELLKVPGASVDTALRQVSLPEGVTVATLLEAVGRNWDDGLIAQVEAENFEAAHLLLDIAAEQLPVAEGHHATLAAGSAAKVEQAERGVRAELEAEGDRLATALRHARLNNEVSDEQDGALASVLEDARRQSSGRDLATVRKMLRGIAALLPEYQAEAKARLTVRLKQLEHDQRVDSDTFERITRLMDDGQLSTAEELIYFLEIDEDVPEVYQSEDLRRFFPVVPNALPRGVTHELVMLVSRRGRLEDCQVLDFRELSPDLAETASDALNCWRQVSHAEPAQRSHFSEPGQLLPALRMIGIEGGRVKQLNDLPRSRDRRFIEVTINGIIGNALVPAFGSKLDGRLRVLLAWGQPSADLLMSWAEGDQSGASLLIAHFGTMSTQTRRDLAVRVVRHSAAVAVLDDAALVYLAAHGNRQINATLNVLLPFSNVNPYLRQKRGVVAPEMFYGRDEERRSVLDPDGTQLVFGGRGLGKSALLNSAAGQFQERTKTIGEHVAVYLDLKAVGIRPDSAINQEAIWDALLDALTRCGVLAVPGKNARRISPREQVQSGVQDWLDADSRRRLLVLLDETDQFFEADMPHFLETTRLKSLGQQNNGRVKVVFAGLHSVQRFAKTARNAPFGHMAQRPTVIGPLKPQHAANLLTRPLATLGFRFEDPDLVNRVLGYYSYQPFLLQIFANRLIEALHNKRGAVALGTTEPPYVITRTDVESVQTHADLRADIHAAFHETLNLDHRYGVIAHVLAHHAHEHGLDARLTDTQLREECLSYWPIGFARLDVEGFRAYLQEMTGLGVLAANNDGRGWHLRSANVLNMIGTAEDVEVQLLGAAELSVPDEFLALQSRQELPGGRRSPLTVAQVDDLLGDHGNQVRVVLGSHATGVEFVGDAVRAAANVGNRFAVPVVASRRQFEEELVAGTPGERRVVLDDLVSVALNEVSCLEALEAAQTRWPSAPGVTRAAVIVSGPAQMNLWRQLFTGSSLSAPVRLPVGTITLRRYDAATLRVWSLETNMFTSEERRAQLLRVTGGWPILVEQAAQLVRGVPDTNGPDSNGVDEPGALQRLEAELATPGSAARLVAAVGLSDDKQLSRAFEGVLSVIDSGGLTRADLEVASELAVEEPSAAVECLIALQVFDVGTDGNFVPEPLLVRCWPHRA